jgi:hypothetical protein
MCQNFTCEVVGQRRRLNAILKEIVAQKINVILFFDIKFFKYFFRVLHEASGSWLEFLHAFQKHPVFLLLAKFDGGLFIYIVKKIKCFAKRFI